MGLLLGDKAKGIILGKKHAWHGAAAELKALLYVGKHYLGYKLGPLNGCSLTANAYPSISPISLNFPICWDMGIDSCCWALGVGAWLPRRGCYRWVGDEKGLINFQEVEEEGGGEGDFADLLHPFFTFFLCAELFFLTADVAAI